MEMPLSKFFGQRSGRVSRISVFAAVFLFRSFFSVNWVGGLLIDLLLLFEYSFFGVSPFRLLFRGYRCIILFFFIICEACERI